MSGPGLAGTTWQAMLHVVQGAPVLDFSRLKEKRPEVLGGAGLRHPSLRGPSGLLEEILLIEGAGTAVLRRRVVQCTDHAA